MDIFRHENQNLNNFQFLFQISRATERNKLLYCHFKLLTWLLEGDVVFLGWPIASSNMSDRLERKRQNAGGAGSHWLCTLYSYGAQLNFYDLTPYILPQKTDNKHKSAWVQAVGGNTQQNHNTKKAVAWDAFVNIPSYLWDTFFKFGQQFAERGE